MEGEERVEGEESVEGDQFYYEDRIYYRKLPCMMGELSRRKKLCRYFEMKALRQEKASAASQREVIQYTSPLLNSLLTFIAEVESKEGCTQ